MFDIKIEKNDKIFNNQSNILKITVCVLNINLSVLNHTLNIKCFKKASKNKDQQNRSFLA